MARRRPTAVRAERQRPPRYKVFLEHLCSHCHKPINFSSRTQLVPRPAATGVHPAHCRPGTWLHDQTLLDRPGNDEVQLALFRDYPTNIDGYPQLQEYFRTSQVPLLAVWGAGDEIFGPDGARAFTRDLPDSEVHMLPAGHFALETHLDAISGYIRGLLGRVLN